MDSRLMKMKKGYFDQAFNIQLLVEGKGEMIVANNLSNSPTDVGETIPLMEKFKQEQKVSLEAKEVYQDNGYSTPKTAEYYENEGAIAYIPDTLTTQIMHGKIKEINKYDLDNFELDFKANTVKCPEGHIMEFHRRKIRDKLGTGRWVNVYKTSKCVTCICSKQCITADKAKNYRYIEINPLMRKIRLRFKNPAGIKKYNERFHKGEVAQAHILHNLGYRSFNTRGIESCYNELNLMCAAYNIKKILNNTKKRLDNVADLCMKIGNFIQNPILNCDTA
jgi:transposase